jgi:hypothetical protein
MGKITNPPLMPLCVCVNLIKKLIVTNPFLFVEFKLNYIHIYVDSHYQKE